MRTASLVGCLALSGALAIGCDGGGLPGGLRATPDGTGPLVRWDLSARPLPEIPLPNDVATWPDPSSPTGRRVNASFVAPTELESSIRELFGTLDGWGTYQPITVAFEAPLDLEALLDAQGGNAYGEGDWGRHAVYLVNLETGVPVPLDVNGGNFHYGLPSTGSYFANDPRAAEANLLFESVEEDLDGDDVLDPGEDTDFDGVLDHPNTLDGTAGATPDETYDRMVWFYERETDTLFLRPVLPLEERTEYAVVLTDRLRGEDGAPVRSPFPFVHHVSQTDSLRRLPDALAMHPEIYGDLATRGWDGVAFAWTFTTQSVTTDLVELRDGLYGRGPYAFLAEEFPPVFHASPLRGALRGGSCDVGTQVYTITMEQFRDILAQLAGEAFGLSEEDTNLLLSTFDNVSHFVFGFYESPYFLGDPNEPSHDASFDLASVRANHTVGRDLVPVVMVVPRESAEHAQPFPVAFYGHGHTSVNLEGIGFAGLMARNGIATVAIDAEGHGFGLDPGFRRVVEAVFASNCAEPMGRAVTIDRSRDLDGDGTPDSGGNFWSAYLFHTRDVVRQSVLDQIQLLRILRHFGADAPGGAVAATPFTLEPLDGASIEATGDYDGDGTADPLQGDFDADGRPDIGGWTGEYHAWGQSLGGFLSSIMAGVDPAVRTAAPTSGAAGLPDVGFRSQLSGVRYASVLRVFGPLLVSEPRTTEPDEDSACAVGEASLQWVVPSVDDRVDTEFACLGADELAEGDAVIARNLVSGEVRCAGVTAGPRFRVGLPADAGDIVSLEVFRGGLTRMDYATCTYREDAGMEMPDPVRVVSTWESSFGTRGAAGTCDTCATYQDVHYEVGTDLVAPTEGFGTPRQTPSLRRLLALTQAALEPGDPVNYVRHIFLDPITAEDWESTAPRSLLVASSIGDDSVPIAAGYAMARAAGLLPFMPADAPDVFADYRAPSDFEATWGAASPNDLLNEFHVLEGVPRFHRHPIGTTTDFLVDPDDLSLGQQLFTESGDVGGTIAPLRIAPPLRWTRASRAVIGGDTDAVFDPAVGSYEALSGVLGMYVVPFGNHGTEVPDGRKTWDEGVYFPQMVGRWYFTGGEDLRYHTDPTGHGCLEDSSCDFLVRVP